MAECEQEEFGELLKFTGAGFVGGLAMGGLLDWLGFGRSAVGQWLVRTLAGEGESICEGVYALRRRLRSAAGIDVYAAEGFYIPYFYAMGDQIGGNASGLLYLRRKSSGWREALGMYSRHPVMMVGLALVLLIPLGLLGARLLGFSPSTQVLTALETIAANLCWLPPLAGYIAERRKGGSDE